MITTNQIKSLRDLTGVSVMQCKKALEEADGDMAKALLVLKKKSSDISAKKGERTLSAGAVSAYIHNNGNVGAIILLSTETDFVAKNEEFKALAYDIAMQVTATNPEYISADDIDEKTMANVRAMLLKDMAQVNKDEAIKEEILAGKMSAYFKDKILLEQSFIKDDNQTIRNLIDKAVQKFGERIEVSQISRFSSNR